MLTSSGLHHVTAITSDAQRNLDFYTQTLGLRLVKLTVNFDDPTSYHFYYGDSSGKPGSILTFFVWSGARSARNGRGVVETTWFRVPAASLQSWKTRFDERDVASEIDGNRLKFRDFDGLNLELRVDETPTHFEPWTQHVPLEHAIRGIGGVVLNSGSVSSTKQILAENLGFEIRGESLQSETNDGVEFVDEAVSTRALTGAGGVHHVAFRARDDAQQTQFLSELRAQGLGASPVMDRTYFHSIYFREPGGVLFEIATDAPGFGDDEPLETLGSHLKLPPWLEAERAMIEANVSPLRLPEAVR